MRLVSWSTVFHLYWSDSATLDINIHSDINEQNNIVSLISDIDKTLTLLKEEKKQMQIYKKGIMQKIFNQEIRFKDDDGNEFGDWEEKKLGDIIIDEKSTNRPAKSALQDWLYPFFTNSTSNQSEFLNEFDYEGEYIIANTWWEAFFDYYNWKIAVMSDNYVFWSNNNVIYIYYILKNLEQEINRVCFYGSWIKHLDKHYFKNLEIKIPVIKEQEKIANFISDIDKKLENIDKEIEKINNYKKWVMQEIFG